MYPHCKNELSLIALPLYPLLAMNAYTICYEDRIAIALENPKSEANVPEIYFAYFPDSPPSHLAKLQKID
jgi:hypothetical protein